MSVRGIVGLVSCFVVTFAAWGGLAYDIAWTFPGDGGFSAANVIRDIKTGKTLGIVACQGAIGVVCVDLKGNRLWEHRMVPLVTAAPAVADINGDGLEEVIAADSDGNLVALSGDGKPIWAARLPGGVVADSCPAVAELTGDGKQEILVGDTTGTLSCFDSQGTMLWQFSGDEGQMSPMLIADIYDTPGKEIIIGSQDRHVYVLTAQGRWIWDYSTANDMFPNSTPILADVDKNNVPELYVGGGLHHFYRFDLINHKAVLEENVYLHINGSISAADLDGDGMDEVVFGNKTGGLWRYGAEGFKWTKEFRKSGFYAAPLFVNLDEDPGLEIIMHSVSNDVQILKADGSLLLAATTPCPSNATPLVGDFDDDGMLEIIATQPGWNAGKGMIAWVELGVPYRKNPLLPDAFAGNRARTGRAPEAKDYPLLPTPRTTPGTADGAGVVSVGEQRVLSGANTWRFDVTNPNQQRLVLTTCLTYPDGVTRQFVRHVMVPTKRVTISFDVATPGACNTENTLLQADGLGVVVTEKKTLTFEGFTGDEKYLNSVVFAGIEEDIRVWRATNARCASYAFAELLALRGRLAQVAQEKGAERTALMTDLRDRAERLRHLVRAAKTLASTGNFFAWEFTPWAYFDNHDSLPDSESLTTGLNASLCMEEYKSFAVNLTNVCERTLDVRVLCDKLEGPETYPVMDHVQFRRAITVPTERRELVSDALPLLDQASTISIASLESQQLWITVNAVGMKPGKYTANLHIKSVEVVPTDISLPITFTVHDLALPRPRPLRFCLWTSEGGDMGTGQDYVLKDLVEHGTTVFLGTSPSAECNAQGELTGKVDFTAHDKSVARLTPHGIILFGSPQNFLLGQPILSEPWRKAFVAYMRAWSMHMKELGVDYSAWAVYPYDEPSTPFNETLLNLVEVAKLVRETDPKIRIYADPTSGTTMQSVEMLKDLVGIWCPSSELLDRLGTELVPALHRMNKEVWFYDAPGRAKTLSSLGHYRWWFWYAWAQDFTGAGWWCYGAHHGASRWDGPDKTEGFFSTVYEGQGSVVASKRWEASREGVTDYEYLYLLRQCISDAEKKGIPADKLADAKKMLHDVPAEYEPLLRRMDERLLLTPDSVPAYKQMTGKLDEVRRAIVEMCLRLKTL